MSCGELIEGHLFRGVIVRTFCKDFGLFFGTFPSVIFSLK